MYKFKDSSISNFQCFAFGHWPISFEKFKSILSDVILVEKPKPEPIK